MGIIHSLNLGLECLNIIILRKQEICKYAEIAPCSELFWKVIPCRNSIKTKMGIRRNIFNYPGYLKGVVTGS